MIKTLLAMKAAIVAACATPAALAAQDFRTGGKLVLTGGVTSVEGAAGGGLATWSLIAGNETDAGIGGGASLTQVELEDFGLTSYGAKIGLFDRVELSYARQRFDTKAAGAALGLGAGFAFSQDVFGLKVRLVGDAIYDQDRPLPQVALSVQHKRANRGAVIRAVGGKHASGTDFVLSATKLVLSRSLLIDASARLTKANQFGLLGFGGDRGDDYSLQFEGSAALLLSRRFALGGELRTKPDNLAFAQEDDALDLFAAYALTRNLTVTAAYVDLGDIATVTSQRGLFLSLQAGF